ncbi:MAG TPA: cytochrome P450 [Streptosporangiaceae bacterium]|nr:cytochrome P450 [Streptosporangiaceae bacterium]
MSDARHRLASPVSTSYPVGAAATVAELEADPHSLLARLRAREPVSWLPALGGWLVTRHDIAQHVMRDAATFTVDDPRFSTAQVIGPSMLSLDGMAHTRHREPFARSFRPADVRSRFATLVTTEADRLITAVAPAGAAELRQAIAGPLSVAVVAAALGLQDADAAVIRSWYHSFVEAISEITAGREAPEAAAAAFGMLRMSVEATLRRGPASSLLAAAEAGAGGGGLTTAEVVSNAAVLMFGGIDTTEAMITNAVAHLLGHPAQLTLVRADPGLLPNAIEESVRLEPAAAVIDRYATKGVRLAGAPIARGDLVRISIAGANRDPGVFPDPDRFDVRRDNLRPHLAFARGPHFCFGAHVARLETQAAVRGLLDQLPGLRIDPGKPSAPSGLVFRKPAELYVRWN